MTVVDAYRMMYEKKSEPPFDVSKADYAGAAKELTQYAKTKGGIDKNDFLAFANRMSAIANKKSPRVSAKFARDLMDLDTSPREKIVSVMRSNGIKVTVQGGGFKIEELTLEELEELDELEEAKVMGREVHDKTFANRTQADNFAKKNGGRVKQVGRVFYVFKEEIEFNFFKEIEEAYKTPAEASAYEAGKKAVAKKVSYDDNPYKKGTKEYTAWSKGHNDARAKMIGNRFAKEEVELQESPMVSFTVPNVTSDMASKLERLAKEKGVEYSRKGRTVVLKGKRSDVTSIRTKMGIAQTNIPMEPVKEDVDEARDPSKSGGTGYDLYHKDFSSAMKHAYDYAKKKFGIEIDPKEIDDKVASGPRKPSAGKTNSYRLKSKDGKKGVQIQVANLDNKKYELNMYKEEVEMENIEEAEFFKWEVKIGGKSWRGTARNAGEAVKKARPSMGNLDLTKASVTRIKEDIDMSLEEAREDTATQVARALKKMGVKPNAKEADIIKKIPGVLKKMGLENDKLIKRDPDFIGDVLDSMNEDIDIQEEQKISLEEAVMLSVFGEAKKDEKKDKKAPETDKEDDGEGMDPVDKKALKKDYDDRAKDGDGDIDNDGDEDKNDKYLHKKRQAVTKAIAKKKGPESSKKGEPVDTNPTMDEEVERIMASFNPNRFAHYGNRAEQVMKLTAIKMAEKKHK